MEYTLFSTPALPPQGRMDWKSKVQIFPGSAPPPPTPTPLPEQVVRYDRWSLDGLRAGQILKHHPRAGQGRAGLNWQTLAHLQEQRERARALRARRVQEAWARGPLRPASPLWTIAVATAPGHPLSGPGTKALCGSLKTGRGRPALPGTAGQVRTARPPCRSVQSQL